MLTCTECYHVFPPRYFRGQIREFRMCETCKQKNPEICQYLDKYIYHPDPINNRSPVQKIVQKCELLKLKLTFSKRQYDNKQPTTTSLENKEQAIQLLQSLILKFENFERGVMLAKSQLGGELNDMM